MNRLTEPPAVRVVGRPGRTMFTAFVSIDGAAEVRVRFDPRLVWRRWKCDACPCPRTPVPRCPHTVAVAAHMHRTTEGEPPMNFDQLTDPDHEAAELAAVARSMSQARAQSDPKHAARLRRLAAAEAFAAQAEQALEHPEPFNPLT